MAIPGRRNSGFLLATNNNRTWGRALAKPITFRSDRIRRGTLSRSAMLFAGYAVNALCANPSYKIPLDITVQISGFRKLELTNCARPGNRAGFFVAHPSVWRPCGRTMDAKQRMQQMPFQKAQSGNPLRRPPGARSKATLIAQSLLQGKAEAMTRVAIERAKAGDMAALRMCLDRLAPSCRHRTMKSNCRGSPARRTRHRRWRRSLRRWARESSRRRKPASCSSWSMASRACERQRFWSNSLRAWNVRSKNRLPQSIRSVRSGR
jgi:hypothetical protein